MRCSEKLLLPVMAGLVATLGGCTGSAQPSVPAEPVNVPGFRWVQMAISGENGTGSFKAGSRCGVSFGGTLVPLTRPKNGYVTVRYEPALLATVPIHDGGPNVATTVVATNFGPRPDQTVEPQMTGSFCPAQAQVKVDATSLSDMKTQYGSARTLYNDLWFGMTLLLDNDGHLATEPKTPASAPPTERMRIVNLVPLTRSGFMENGFLASCQPSRAGSLQEAGRTANRQVYLYTVKNPGGCPSAALLIRDTPDLPDVSYPYN